MEKEKTFVHILTEGVELHRGEKEYFFKKDGKILKVKIASTT